MRARVRSARAADLPEILELYNHYVLHSAATFDLAPVRVEDRNDWFRQHARTGPHRLLVAEDRDGGIAGWASSSPHRARAGYATTVESSVYCRPSALGRGIGSRLYSTLFETLRAERIERIVAGIALPNPASIALHERFEFRSVGVFTRVGYKFDRFWDVEWFERPLRLVEGSQSRPVLGRA